VSIRNRAETTRLSMLSRYERLEEGRRTGYFVSVGKRFFQIDGLSQGGLLAIELFTTIIPLMIIGFAALRGFSSNANVGNLFIRQLGLEHPLDDTVRETFDNAKGLAPTWSIVGIAGWLVWGIPMSLTVSNMFSLAWVREPFGIGSRLLRGYSWFLLYLATLVVTERLSVAGSYTGVVRAVLWTASLIPIWIFWSLTPVLLVRDGARGLKFLGLAGLVGVVVDGVVIRAAGRVVFPSLLEGWTGFGPIGVAMTLMTWCGVIGVAWVVTACAGAMVWERNAPVDTVLDAQSAEVEAAEAAHD
jgi:hypothetical protein